jgi:hypothetical protein
VKPHSLQELWKVSPQLILMERMLMRKIVLRATWPIPGRLCGIMVSNMEWLICRVINRLVMVYTPHIFCML